MITCSKDHSESQALLAWAKATVVAQGLDSPLLSNRNLTFSESDLLGELAWVILCSGFRERVVRRIFGKISLCFFDWASAATIRGHVLPLRVHRAARQMRAPSRLAIISA